MQPAEQQTPPGSRRSFLRALTLGTLALGAVPAVAASAADGAAGPVPAVVPLSPARARPRAAGRPVADAAAAPRAATPVPGAPVPPAPPGTETAAAAAVPAPVTAPATAPAAAPAAGPAAAPAAAQRAVAADAPADPVDTAAPPEQPVLRRGSDLGALPAGTAGVVHLLRRTTFGLTPTLLAEVTAAGGAARWLDQQLAPQTVPDTACDAAVTRFPLRDATPQTCWATLSNGAWDSMFDVCSATLARQLWSKRQLFEVMVDFWSNHLNVTCPSSEVWAARAAYDVDVVRKHALGRFDDMLVASLTSPAMLTYLNNADSRGSAPNENHGRELLELHTVGVDAGYAQRDVVDAARALTGLTLWSYGSGVTAANRGSFRYRSDWRYVGPVRVLGWSSANADPYGGVGVATSLGRYLAAHPSTARRLATKLVTRFVSDVPPAALVDRLAQVYLDNGTAIVPVLRALFGSAEFAASAGRKYRRPAEDVIASYRVVGMAPAATDVSPDTVRNVYWQLASLGNAPLGWHPPNGYPDVAPAWTGSGATLGRWNLHQAVTGQWWKAGVTYPDLRTLLLGETPPTTRAGVVAQLFSRLVPGAVVPDAHRAALVTFLGGDGPTRSWDLTGGTFSVLVGLVLDSPTWSVR